MCNFTTGHITHDRYHQIWTIHMSWPQLSFQRISYWNDWPRYSRSCELLSYADFQIKGGQLNRGARNNSCHKRIQFVGNEWAIVSTINVVSVRIMFEMLPEWPCIVINGKPNIFVICYTLLCFKIQTDENEDRQIPPFIIQFFLSGTKPLSERMPEYC